MRIGESAAFDVHPELGYGSKGKLHCECLELYGKEMTRSTPTSV